MDDKEAKDKLAAMRAQTDQAKEASREMAATMWAFYEALRGEGFEPEEALQLLVTWFTIMLTSGGIDDDG